MIRPISQGQPPSSMSLTQSCQIQIHAREKHITTQATEICQTLHIEMLWALEEICRIAVNHSQGQLLTSRSLVKYLLNYIAQRDDVLERKLLRWIVFWIHHGPIGICICLNKMK
ncbi:hypothetical protein K7X08_000037 [Anisodus acutangulus]|uniref:Uncharacterized protein n=1 Tax=Anisodus acutangulus TaxID=402998 RepID=A0A9Q1M2P8_9SOLA|nr:hypothetical protein K7X08_000037 [Anisodus acutangulus]